MLAVVTDVLFGPKPADQAHELLGTVVALCLVALLVAIGGEIVEAGDDVHAHASAGEVVERGSSRGEVRGSPVARADRYQRLERPRARRKRGGKSKGIRSAPTRADERSLPAMILECPRMLRQHRQAIVVCH
jgi:hypothetical protein